MRHFSLACVAFVALAAAGCSPKGDGPATSSATSGAVAGVKYIDQTVRVGETEVVVNEMWSLEDYPDAPAGATAVIVKWTVHNAGDKPLAAKAFPTMHLIDANGTVYNADIGLSEDVAKEHPVTVRDGSDLNPGLAMSNLSVFEVATNRFDLSTWYMSPGNDVKMAFCSAAQAVDGKCPRSMTPPAAS